MAITIISPSNSYVQFGIAEAAPLCIWGDINFCLPIYEDNDTNFQFVVEGTEYDIDSLCTQTGDELEVSLVSECNTTPLVTFSDKPQRFRLSSTQILYNWDNGLPAFTNYVSIGECFKIQLTITATPYGYPEDTDVVCSNCFERIGSDCFTSIIEYGNEDDAFGFKYCNGGDIQTVTPDETTCEPTIATFVGVATLVIPYTTLLINKYGVFPTVQVWIYDGSGQLLNMGITAAFDTYPPTMINFDFGGIASGIIIIR